MSLIDLIRKGVKEASELLLGFQGTGKQPVVLSETKPAPGAMNNFILGMTNQFSEKRSADLRQHARRKHVK